MKRWICSVVLAGISAVVLAQAPFTIVRPADGSRVREKVRILIPKDSVPPGGYVGVFLDGKLIEATVPPIEGKYRVYTLDTKGRGIPDTDGRTVKLELVLYTDYEDKARIVDRSSVDVKIGNQASIPIPNSGIKLRYNFRPGTEMIYNLSQMVQVSSISEQQQKLGGKAAQADMDLEKIRLLYAVENAYGDGSGLLRIQALPTKGKDYADLTVAGDTEPKRFYTDAMAPLYMRVLNTGQEVFGALPPSIPLFGNSAGSADPTHLYASFPLPTLPTKAVRPGDAWQGNFQQGALDLNKYPNIESVVTKVPARGEFVNVEWEQGHPCAKIMNSIEAASLDANKKKQLSGLAGGGSGPIDDDKISIKETIWFSLDTHKVMKIVRDLTLDVKAQSTGGFGGGGPMGPGGPPPGMGPGGPGGKGMGGGGMGAGSIIPPSGKFQKGGGPGRGGGMGGPGVPGQGGPPMGPMGPGGPPPGMGGQGGMMGGGAPVQNTYVRIRMLQIFTLEK